MKTAILVYEIAQIEELEQVLSSIDKKDKYNYIIIALGADIEFRLEKVGIQFISGRGFRKTLPVERLTFAQKLSWDLFKSKELAFFSYKNIALGKIHAAALQQYLSVFLYYLCVLDEIVQSSHRFKRVIVLPSHIIVSSTSALLAEAEVNVVVDASKVVCAHHGIEVQIPHKRTTIDNTGNISFIVKRTLFGYALTVLNFIQLLRPRKKIRLLITDYWKNINPYITELPEAEIILMDRGEVFKAGWRNVWRHKMQFVHSTRFSSSHTHKISKEYSNKFITEWESKKKDIALIRDTVFHGYVLQGIIEAAVNRIITVGGEGTVLDIENTYTMIKVLTPDAVMVRASVSLQRHFAILCYVARSLNIPSIEVQHGLLYLGPGSYANHPTAEYIADYGSLARQGLRGIGYTDDKLFDIGSPRFDIYAHTQEKLKKEDGQRNILCIVPAVSTGLWVDTYEIIDFCQSIATAVREIPGIEITMKLRPGYANQVFYEEVFKRVFNHVSYTIAQKEPLYKLGTKTDIIVSCYSTALLEALLVQKPVIYIGILPMHESLGAEIRQYEDEGALLMAHSTEDLKCHISSVVASHQLQNKLSVGAHTFMKEHYSFVGDASKCLAKAMWSIIKEK